MDSTEIGLDLVEVAINHYPRSEHSGPACRLKMRAKEKMAAQMLVNKNRRTPDNIESGHTALLWDFATHERDHFRIFNETRMHRSKVALDLLPADSNATV